MTVQSQRRGFDEVAFTHFSNTPNRKRALRLLATRAPMHAAIGFVHRNA